MALKELFSNYPQLFEYLEYEEYEKFSDFIQEQIDGGDLDWDDTAQLTKLLYDADLLDDLIEKYTGIPYWTNFDLFTSYKIPESIQIIPDNAFYGCNNLESIILPNSIKVIGESAFMNCRKLKSINIPESVEQIDREVFQYDESLESITIPGNIHYIDRAIFYGCTGLQDVYFDMTYEKLMRLCNYESFYDYLDIPLHVTIHYKD